MNDESRGDCECCDGTGGVCWEGVVLTPCERCDGTGDDWPDGILDEWLTVWWSE